MKTAYNGDTGVGVLVQSAGPPAGSVCGILLCSAVATSPDERGILGRACVDMLVRACVYTICVSMGS